MRLVIQRVSRAQVEVSNKIVGSIKKGYLIYLGISEDDTKETMIKAAKKVSSLRIFEDEKGKMNLNITQSNGEILVISQFTLLGETKGNNRPSFTKAARPDQAKALYELFIKQLELEHHVEKGIFGANMSIDSTNDGPVTILIEI